MKKNLTQAPAGPARTFLNFPFQDDLETMKADFAVLGIPFGMPYSAESRANDQSLAPDALRLAADGPEMTTDHYDWDLGGPLRDNRDIRIVDCGNVIADRDDASKHYDYAELAARKIFTSGTKLISIGGDHGIPIPVMRALEVFREQFTLVHIDAHLDWRDDVNGEKNGYSSPIRRASEMPWIDHITQIGLRGIGSARNGEVEDAKTYGADLISAYDMHDMGIEAVLDRIPDDKPYYLTIDADGIDPTIMPAVLAPTPGGMDWIQLRKLIHGLLNKGPVVGMDLVEIAPSRDFKNTTMYYAERLICNFIGASIRSPHWKR